MTVPIVSKQQSNKFLATNVTKMLDHYNHYPPLVIMAESQPRLYFKYKGSLGARTYL